MNVRSCFSVPIYTYQFSGGLLDLIQNEILLSLKTVKSSMAMPWPELVSSTFNWNGGNNFLDSVPTLRDQILDHYKIFLKDAGAKSIPELSISASFLNIMVANGFQFSHHHPDSIISGVYYYQIDSSDASRLVFENPNQVCDFVDPTGNLWPNHAEENPEQGKLVMFPSWLKHRVNLSTSKFERIAIAFNLS